VASVVGRAARLLTHHNSSGPNQKKFFVDFSPVDEMARKERRSGLGAARRILINIVSFAALIAALAPTRAP